MEFIAHPEIFARFPGIQIAVTIAEGLDNATPDPQIETAWRTAWISAVGAAQYGNAQSHPRILPWREHFRAQGISGKEFPSSAEALLRRALKGGEPFTINPLVDWYNALSLRHFVPAGAFDLAQLSGPIELRLTTAGDTFFALDAPAAITIPAGEVAYTDGHTVITRHFVWRQSRAGLITPETTKVMLLSEILGEVGAPVAEAMLADFHAGLREYFGISGRGGMVDAAHMTFTW